MTNYDIFISYRREGGREIARTIKLALEARGYSNIFFDYNSLRDGVFNEAIIAAIQNCKDFILVLSDGAMDRCSNENDWVAREIRTAITSGCKIIPVKVNHGDWSWPADFPKDLSILGSIQFTTLLTNEYFDSSIQYITERLTTEPSSKNSTTSFVSHGNPFIDTCLRNALEGKNEFDYVFRDCNYAVTVQPLIDFVLYYSRSDNSPEQLSATLQNMQYISDEDFEQSLAIFKIRTFSDIFGNPRFMLSIDNKYAVKVSCQEGFCEKGQSVTEQMYNALKDYVLTKDICTACIEKLISDPFSVSSKSKNKEDIDEYVACYKKTLEEAISIGAYRLHFKPNPKYPMDPEKVYYIGFSDMYAYQYCIREGEYENYHDDDDKIVASYASAEELLRDGWQLD